MSGDPEELSRGARLAAGLLLVPFFLAVTAVCAWQSAGVALLDVDGTRTWGSVVDKRVARWSSRFRGRMASLRVEVRYEDAAGASWRTTYSVGEDTFDRVSEGGSIEVTYWKPFPRLSTVEKAEFGDPWFLLFSAGTLLFAWLTLMTLLRSVRPPPA